MEGILQTIINFIGNMGFNYIFGEESFVDGVWMGWQYLVMYLIAGVLIYLAIGRKFEPLLLLPIAIGMLLTNLPGANLFHLEMWVCVHGIATMMATSYLNIEEELVSRMLSDYDLGLKNRFPKEE